MAVSLATRAVWLSVLVVGWPVNCQLVQVQKSQGRSSDCTTLEGHIGECVREVDCPAVTAGLYFPSFCSLGQLAGVCCEQPEDAASPEPVSVATEATVDDSFSCGSISYGLTIDTGITDNKEETIVDQGILQPRAGLSPDLIVGGEVVGELEQPWNVALGTEDKDGEINFICGGSLISEKSVVTAAHCVGELGKNPVVYLGATNLTQRTGTRRGLSGVYPHPEWSTQPGQPDHDIAILILDQAVPSSKEIAPVCLPDDNISLEKRTAVVSGWGRLSSGGPTSSSLLSTQVKILSDTECGEVYKGVIPTAGGRVLCGQGRPLEGEGGRRLSDACQGDSGGPLVLEENGRAHLVGVVSGGIGCGSTRYPGLYVSVAPHLEWIKQIST